jgi:C4-dicarboxylate-specific signal transduction histidine kinase
MEVNNDRTLCAAKGSFIGMILEGFSHELKNHLAVIRESNGLMHDIMEMKKMDKERAGQCLETIRSVDRQIDKSVSLLSSLDGFSRGMKTKNGPCNVNETIHILLSLLQRRMSQRKITIEKAFDNKICPIPCNPLDLQFVVFCCIEEVMRMVGHAGSVIVDTTQSEKAITIRIVAKAPLTHPTVGEEASATPPLRRIVEEMGGMLARNPGHFEVVLTLRRQT